MGLDKVEEGGEELGFLLEEEMNENLEVGWRRGGGGKRGERSWSEGEEERRKRKAVGGRRGGSVGPRSVERRGSWRNG